MLNEYIQFPQRKIKKSYRSVTGHFPSIKNDKSIGFESLLEKSLFLSLEFDNSVAGYYEQPQIKISLNDKYVTYSVDCYVMRTKSSKLKDTLIEVKYTSELEKKKEQLEKKFDATKLFVHEHDLSFDIFTEKTYSEIYLDNLDFLYRYKVNPIEHQYEKEIFEILNETETLSAYDVTQKISTNPKEYAIIANTIWSLVSSEKLKTDLNISKLTMNSMVEVNNG